jgi:hypothetical protein
MPASTHSNMLCAVLKIRLGLSVRGSEHAALVHTLGVRHSVLRTVRTSHAGEGKTSVAHSAGLRVLSAPRNVCT